MLKGSINLVSLKFFIAGILSGILGLHIFNVVTAPKLPTTIDSTYSKVDSKEKMKIFVSEKLKQKNFLIQPQTQTKKSDISGCEVIENSDASELKVRFSFQLEKLQKHFPEIDLASIPEKNLKDVLVTAAMDMSKNSTQRIESLAALKLLDESPLPSELVDQVISDLPRFIANNDSPSAVEALMLIEDDVQEYQFSQLLELNRSDDVDIRMATIFAIANADPYRQNKHVFEQLYKYDKSKMVRDTAYNILKNEYSYE